MISKKILLTMIPAVLIITAAVYLSCGKFDRTASDDTVAFSGSVVFPEEADIDLDKVTVSFGDSESGVNGDSAFSARGTNLVPGLAMAMEGDSVILLMKVVPYPMEGMNISMDIFSTAEALVYMNPLICVGGDYKKAQEILADIDALPELQDLVELLEDRLAEDPYALGDEDEEISEAVADVIDAFLEAYPDYWDSKLNSMGLIPRKGGMAVDEGSGIGIIPTTQTGGHSLTHAGNSVFQITNAYGRWAILVNPKDNDKQIWLPPNGCMLDFIKDGLPWAPSSRTFNMNVTTDDDTVLVNIYGYGMSGAAENTFANLTDAEKIIAHKAGLMTFFFEFCGNVGSVIANSVNGVRGIDNYEKFLENDLDTWWLDLLASDATFMGNITLLYEQELYTDMAWTIFKKITELMAANETARNFVFRTTNLALKDAQKGRFEALVSSPAFYATVQGVLTGNKLTSVMKTVYGFGDARLKTSFKVWREAGQFGNITGYVMEKESPFGPIEDATVVLTGDEANPLPSHVTRWLTDGDGGFRFSDCLIGSKTVTASKAGYKTASATVAVLEGASIEVTIELEKQAGTISGLIVNEIFSRWRAHPLGNPGQDTLFQGDVFVYARGTILSQPFEESWTVSNGIIQKELPVGTLWIVAETDNYFKDSVQVVVQEDETTNLSRRLLMKAQASMKAKTIYLTDYAQSPYSLDFSLLACSPVMQQGSDRAMVFAGGIAQTIAHEFDVMLNLKIVNEPGFYDMAKGYKEFPNKKGAIATYATNMLRCVDNDPMFYYILGVPGYEECDCDIEYAGNIVFTEFSTELGEPVAGSISCKLAGWQNCECDSVDSNGDDIMDKIEVYCQVADIDVDFRFVVGHNFWELAAYGGKASPEKPRVLNWTPKEDTFLGIWRR